MIKEDTQLVLVDEWSADTIQSDFAKTIAGRMDGDRSKTRGATVCDE